MKATFKLPKTKVGWFSLLLIVFVVSLGSWPLINLFNRDIIFLGLPLLMIWSIVVIFVTTLSMILINKIGGVD